MSKIWGIMMLSVFSVLLFVEIELVYNFCGILM